MICMTSTSADCQNLIKFNNILYYYLIIVNAIWVTKVILL